MSTKFIELETSEGLIMFNVGEITYVRPVNKGETTRKGSEICSAILLRTGETFFLKDEYRNASGYISWVSDGCPEFEEECDECSDAEEVENSDDENNEDDEEDLKN